MNFEQNQFTQFGEKTPSGAFSIWRARYFPQELVETKKGAKSEWILDSVDTNITERNSDIAL